VSSSIIAATTLTAPRRPDNSRPVCLFQRQFFRTLIDQSAAFLGCARFGRWNTPLRHPQSIGRSPVFGFAGLAQDLLTQGRFSGFHPGEFKVRTGK